MNWNQDCDIVIEIRDGRMYRPLIPMRFGPNNKMVPSTCVERPPFQYVTHSDWEWILDIITDILDKSDEDSTTELNQSIYNGWLEMFKEIDEYTHDRKFRPQKKRSQKPGYVYVIKAGPYYKIGRTKNLDTRIMQLSTQPPFDIEFVHAIWTPEMTFLESKLHNKFAAKHKNGEWFELDEEDVAWLRTL